MFWLLSKSYLQGSLCASGQTQSYPLWLTLPWSLSSTYAWLRDITLITITEVSFRREQSLLFEGLYCPLWILNVAGRYISPNPCLTHRPPACGGPEVLCCAAQPVHLKLFAVASFMHLYLFLSEKFAPLPFRGRKLIHSYSTRDTKVEGDKLFYQRLLSALSLLRAAGSGGLWGWAHLAVQKPVGLPSCTEARGASSLMTWCWLLETVYFSGDPVVSERKLRFPFLCWCGAGLCQMSHITGWMTSTRKGEVLFDRDATHRSPLWLSEGRCSVPNSFYTKHAKNINKKNNHMVHRGDNKLRSGEGVCFHWAFPGDQGHFAAYIGGSANSWGTQDVL